jgi:hypothetical protein
MFLVFLKSSSGQWVDARYVRSFSVDYSQRDREQQVYGAPSKWAVFVGMGGNFEKVELEELHETREAAEAALEQLMNCLNVAYRPVKPISA